MNGNHPQPIVKQLVLIVCISIVTAFVYNAVSPKGISLIRTAPVKVSVPDSVLFAPIDTPRTAAPSDSLDRLKDSVRTVMYEREHPGRVQHPTVKKVDRSVYKIISLDQFQRLRKEHRGLVIDARNTDEFQKGHIEGARNIPYMEAEERFEEMIMIPRDTLIIIYCTNPECHLGRGLAEFMNVMEFNNLLLYDDGWDGWVKAGLSVVTTSSQDSSKR